MAVKQLIRYAHSLLASLVAHSLRSLRGLRPRTPISLRSISRLVAPPGLFATLTTAGGAPRRGLRPLCAPPGSLRSQVGASPQAGYRPNSLRLVLRTPRSLRSLSRFAGTSVDWSSLRSSTSIFSANRAHSSPSWLEDGWFFLLFVLFLRISSSN